MASCTYNRGLAGNPYLVLTVTQKSQDKAKNESVLAWDLKLYRPYNIQSSANKAYSVTINGTKVKSDTTTIGGSGTKTIASGEVTVPHNSDGNKTVNFSFSLTLDITWSGTKIGTGTASGSIKLDKIARASSISSIVGNNITANVAITITPANNSYTHEILYYPPGQKTPSDYVTFTKSGNVYNFTPPLSDCQYIPNATSGTAKIVLETYSGGTKIGTAEKTFTLKVPSGVKPQLTLTVEDANSSINQRGGGYLKGFSKLKITAEYMNGGASPIKSCKITVDNAIYNPTITNPNAGNSTITTGLLQKSGTITIKAQVTDSRGRVAEASTTVTVIDYKPPYIDSFTVERCNADGTLSDEGTSIKVTVKGGVTDLKVDGASVNKAYYCLYFKKTTASTYTSIGYTEVTEDTLYLDGSKPQIVSGFDSESAYNMYFEIRDIFTNSTRACNISTAFTLVDYYKDGKGIAFGKVATETGIADFNLKIKANKGITYPEIPINTDLNDWKNTGIYKSINNQGHTYGNCPLSTGTFLLEVYEAGNTVQLMQRITYCSKDKSVKYERFYYGSAWGDWVKTYDQALYSKLNQIGTTYSASLSVQITTDGIDTYTDGATLTIHPGTYIITAGATINTASTSYDRNIQIRLLAGEDVISRERVGAVNFSEIRTTAIYTATEDTVIKCQKSASTAETSKGNTNITAVRIA